jgi:hypothetical protein
MGVFREWQPKYLAERIATFPVRGDGNKRPMVRGWDEIGTNTSASLAGNPRFADCDGIGFRVDRPFGPKITVLDIDIADEAELARAIAKHGETPIIVRTASGKFHGYYRHNGERRWIRPWKNLPIDIVGGGYVVGVPSVTPGGKYEFLKGDLSHVHNLPVLRGVDDLLNPPPESVIAAFAGNQKKVSKGNRNGALFRACMIRARAAESFDELLAWAREFNEANMAPPLMEMEVINAAKSAWGYELRGENFIGGGGAFVTCPPAVVDDLCLNNPDAFVLLMVARRHHWDRERFCLANAMGEKLGWTLPRLRSARNCLVRNNYVVVLHHGGRGAGDATVYGWPQKRAARPK